MARAAATRNERERVLRLRAAPAPHRDRAVRREPDGAWVTRFDDGLVSIPTSVRAVDHATAGPIGSVGAGDPVGTRRWSGASPTSTCCLQWSDSTTKRSSIFSNGPNRGAVESLSARRFRFADALVQHNMYAELSATRRARAHLAVAESLERLGLADDRAAETARHWAVSDSEQGIEARFTSPARPVRRLAPPRAAGSCASLHQRRSSSSIGPVPRQPCPTTTRAVRTAAPARVVAVRSRRPAVPSDGRRCGRDRRTTRRRRSPRSCRARPTTSAAYMSVDDPDRVRILESALAASGNDDTPDRVKLLSCCRSSFRPPMSRFRLAQRRGSRYRGRLARRARCGRASGSTVVAATSRVPWALWSGGPGDRSDAARSGAGRSRPRVDVSRRFPVCGVVGRARRRRGEPRGHGRGSCRRSSAQTSAGSRPTLRLIADCSPATTFAANSSFTRRT